MSSRLTASQCVLGSDIVALQIASLGKGCSRVLEVKTDFIDIVNKGIYKRKENCTLVPNYNNGYK